MAVVSVASSSSLSPPVALFSSTSALARSNPSSLSSPLPHSKLGSLHSGSFCINCWFLQQRAPLALPGQLLDHLLIYHGPTFFSSPDLISASRSSACQRLVAFSTHSSATVLKPNRRSPYGRPISMYGGKDDDKGDKDEEEEYDEEEEEFDDECSDSDEFDDGETESKKSGRKTSLKRGSNSSTNIARNVNQLYRQSNYYENDVRKLDVNGSGHANGRGRVLTGSCLQSNFSKLREELDFDEKWLPLVEYLSSLGLKESDIVSIYERHMPCIQINMSSARERMEYLLGVGVKQRDIRRILLRQPQILEYTVENNLKPHVAFLRGIGVSDSRIGQIICSAPSLFSYSIELSLKPTVRYLVEEVGIKESDVGKVIQLSPQVLVQRIENSWNSRLRFLSKELGAPRDSIVKMVIKHPQILHYSIEDGIQPRINFLRSIGMRNPDIIKVLTSLTQVLSLSLEGNLKPKYLYLVNELNNEVHSLTKYPTYLSLSLEQRIRPRHRFLVSLKRAPKGPFPLRSFVPTDESFCQQWAGTTVEKYLAFRQSLLLTDFAKKYERR